MIDLATSGPAQVGSAPTRAALLQRARRLDWRFLLPDPTLGDVGFLGRDDGRLVDALRADAASLTVVDAATPQEARFDLVVAHDAPLADAPRLLSLLRPGGHLYWELERKRVPFATPGTTRRRLQRAGFESLQLHWHRPGFGAAVDIVPIAAPRLVAAVLQRGSVRASKRALAAAARVLQAARLLDQAVPAWSAVARKPGGQPVVAPAAAAFLAARRPRGAELDPSTLQYRWRLPRFVASSHVICLAYAADAAAPALVLKVPRLQGDDIAVQREAAALDAVHASRPGGFASIPRRVACDEWRGRRWLAQTALPGQVMSAAYVKRHEPACVAAVVAWLLELHRATRGERLGSAGVTRLVGEPAAAATRRGDATAALVAETMSGLGPELASLASVFEHGDLGAPNLLVASGADRGVGVVDWELGEPRGLPAVDLVFFLAFVAGAGAGAATPAAHVAAYDRAFFAPGAWGRSQLAAYAQALELPAAALPQLLAITWMRATLRALERGADAPATARTLALWRHTLDNTHRLEF